MLFLTLLTVAIVAGMSSDVQTCAAERKNKLIYYCEKGNKTPTCKHKQQWQRKIHSRQ